MGGTEEELAAVTVAGWARFTVEQCRAMRAEIGSEPLVLAGHSRGGVVFGPAAELDPYAMDSLAYITAMMPAPGESGMDSRAHVEPTPHMEKMMRAMASQDASAITEAAVELFAHLTPPDEAHAAMSRLVAEPMGPMSEPLALSPGRWGSLPRLYIECLQDRAIAIDDQRRLQERAPGAQRISIDTDHSPFLSTPEELVEALLAAIPE
jgi:pimeloyl-ACP methyl ester carboxylesterase